MIVVVFKLLQLLGIARLLNDIQHFVRINLLNSVEEPEERVLNVHDLQSFLSVRRLHSFFRETRLRGRDNRDEKVEHQDDQHEAHEEEDDPVGVGEEL